MLLSQILWPPLTGFSGSAPGFLETAPAFKNLNISDLTERILAGFIVVKTNSRFLRAGHHERGNN